MAGTQPDANDSTVAQIEILMTTGHSKGEDVDPESERFQIARDFFGFGMDAVDEFGRDLEHALDVAYDSVFQFTTTYDGDVDGLLADLWERHQGGRQDVESGYDGCETRSMYVGDIIVVDGTAYMVEKIGFQELDVMTDADEREVMA